MGVKAVGAKNWPYHLRVPIVLKSVNLDLLEPKVTVQACNGIAFTFYIGQQHAQKQTKSPTCSSWHNTNGLSAKQSSALIQQFFDQFVSKVVT